MWEAVFSAVGLIVTVFVAYALVVKPDWYAAYIVAYNPFTFRTPVNKLRRLALSYLRIPNKYWVRRGDSFVHIADSTTSIGFVADLVINGRPIPDTVIDRAKDVKYKSLRNSSANIERQRQSEELLNSIKGHQ